MIPPLFAIFGWLAVMVILFSKFKPTTALICSLIGAYLLLPHGRGLDLPLIPLLDKNTLPALAVLVVMPLLAAGNGRKPKDTQVLEGWIPKSNLVRLCLVGFLLGMLGTVVTNSDPLSIGARTLPGMRPYDAVSLVLSTLLAVLPLFLARKYLGHPDQHKALMVVIAVSAAFYGLAALYEVRMSPQLHVRFYGFFQHEWKQHVRPDGFRPIVFLEHALVLAIYLACAAVISVGLVRTGAVGRRPLFVFISVGLIGTLVLAKSLGALVIAVLIIPLVIFLGPRLQMTIAASIACVVLLYPMLRGADIIPTTQILEMAASVDEGRASSLQTRFDNEDMLLDKANERPLFGWGSWGRNAVYNEEGENISITDGRWIIVIGIGGWVRYLSEFGLLTSALILLWWNSRSYELTLLTSTMALALSANLIDLIPNAGVTTITWLMAGALLGRAEHGKISVDAVETQAEEVSGIRYSRFKHTSLRGRSKNYGLPSAGSKRSRFPVRADI